MKLGIYINKNKKNLFDILKIIHSEFPISNHEYVYLNESQFILDSLGLSKLDMKVKKDYDILIPIGGDGTILSAIRSEFRNQKPILGIHAGKLGFLAEADIQNCKKILQLVKASNFRIEERSLFNIELINDKIKNHICTNEIVVDRGKSARTMEADVYQNKIFVNRYEGDGLIISTANGSTAYSLSAGGPIISPNLDLITITPICSHSLSTRTIVLDGNSTISITFPDKRTSRTLTVDGQINSVIRDDTTINISISNYKAHFLLTEESDYFNKLRSKMGWFRSIDSKNN